MYAVAPLIVLQYSSSSQGFNMIIINTEIPIILR